MEEYAEFMLEGGVLFREKEFEYIFKREELVNLLVSP